MAPETRYARSGDLHLAYQIVGDGPLDLIYVPTWISQVEHYWEEPEVAHFFERLASFTRLIMFDRRGTGLSDPVLQAPTLEEQMDDVVAVMNAAASDRAAVFAQFEGGAMAAMFAATHPERTSALILHEAMPRMSWAPDYDWALRPEQRRAMIERPWGDGSRIMFLSRNSGTSPRLRAWFAKLERLAVSPGTAAKLTEMNSHVDVRAILPSISVPTLVLHRAEDQTIDIRHSRYLAERIPGAKLVELTGADALSLGPEGVLLLDEVEEFLTGARRVVDPDRILATVMFADIVDSTRHAAELGDRRWREVLEALGPGVMRDLARFRGRAVKTMGDGFLATFDGPARAIRCALSMQEKARSSFGMELRTGLHTGEVEAMGNDVGGLAVNLAARIQASAQPGEVLVSGTVKDLVVGSGIEFADRGEYELKGVPGSWRLFAVAG